MNFKTYQNDILAAVSDPAACQSARRYVFQTTRITTGRSNVYKNGCFRFGGWGASRDLSIEDPPG